MNYKIGVLRSKIAELEAENKFALSELETYKNSNIDFAKHIAELEDVIDRCHKDWDRANSKIRELRDINESYHTALRRLVEAAIIVTSKCTNFGKTFIDNNDKKRIKQAIEEVNNV